MKTRLLLVLAAASSAAAAQAPVPKFTVEKFEIGGDGGHDYITVEPATERLFISRGTHVMVVEGRTGKAIGDIPNTPRVHGIALAAKWGRGFTTNAGDSTVTVFDANTLAVIKQIKIPKGGLDGIMYDPISDRIVLTNHSQPGTATVIDPKDGVIVGNVTLGDESPEGAVADDQGRVFVNNEDKSTIQVFNIKTLKVLHSWPIAPCKGPTGIGMDLRTNRIFAACSGTSVVVNAATGKVVSSFRVGDGVDGLAYDAAEHLLFVPAGRSGNITVARMASVNEFKVVATIPTMPGTKTIALDQAGRVVYTLALRYGPAPAGTPGAGGRPARGPVVGATLFRISR